jgi:hypothetical protein
MSSPSEAAQVIISVIPIVGIVMGGVVVFFYLLWSYKAKRLLIERGQYERKSIDLGTFSLLAGLVLTVVGIVMSVIFLVLDGFSYSLLGGAIPLAIGASLLAFYSMRRDRFGA